MTSETDPKDEEILRLKSMLDGMRTAVHMLLDFTGDTQDPAEVRQLLVHGAAWKPLKAWLAGRGVELGAIPDDSIGSVRTYVMTPSDATMAASKLEEALQPPEYEAPAFNPPDYEVARMMGTAFLMTGGMPRDNAVDALNRIEYGIRKQCAEELTPAAETARCIKQIRDGECKHHDEAWPCKDCGCGKNVHVETYCVTCELVKVEGARHRYTPEAESSTGS